MEIKLEIKDSIFLDGTYNEKDIVKMVEELEDLKLKCCGFILQVGMQHTEIEYLKNQIQFLEGVEFNGKKSTIHNEGAKSSKKTKTK